MPAPSMTTDEYFLTPETVLPQELVYGYVREAAAPSPGHQSAVGNVYWWLRRHVELTDAGRVWTSPVDVVLDRDRSLVVQPDVIVVSHHRLRMVTDRVWGAPDLVVEVMSPKPRIGTLDERLEWFATYGVRECWLVWQAEKVVEVIAFDERAIESRRRFAADELIASRVLPGLNLTPADILM